MAARIVVVGSMNMDLVIRSPRIPKPGETIVGGDLVTVPGGKGANQAVAASRLGAQVAMVGRVGQDDFGQKLLNNLTTNGVDCRAVIQDPGVATGVALIMVDDAGENSIVVSLGANMRLSPDNVEAAEPIIAAAQVLLLQLESPLESVIRAAQLARAHGLRVILNPAPAQPAPKALIELVDVLVPNQHEAAMMSGMTPVNEPYQAAVAARALQAMGIDQVVITLGERGALLASGRSATLFPAFPITAVDTTAAGDAFVAGLSVALAEGKPLEEAVWWGNAAGALAATQLGAQTSLPTRERLEAMLASTERPRLRRYEHLTFQ